MGVGEILLIPSEVALTFPGNNAEPRRPAPPAGPSAAGNTALDSNQKISSESENENAQRNKDKVRHLVQDLAGGNSELSIAVDQDTRKIVVKVLNSETHEVIRQIPPEEALHLAHTLEKLHGALVDEVA
jgi:flagellar protein FlaG